MEREEELSIICVKVVVEGREEIRVLRGVVYMTKSSVAVGRSLFVFHLVYLQSSAFSLISSSGNLA